MVVHSGQVEALQADAGHAVLYLLRPQLRRLLLLLDQPGRRNRRLKLPAASVWSQLPFRMKDYGALFALPLPW